MVDLILFSCTAGSFLGGKGFDQELTRHLEQLTGVRVTTTSTCVLRALKALACRRLNVVTPYSPRSMRWSAAFWRHAALRSVHYRRAAGAFAGLRQADR
ncbi:MAG: hypothetical protein ACLU9S_05305 [Oscillospiraceae bacterium]